MNLIKYIQVFGLPFTIIIALNKIIKPFFKEVKPEFEKQEQKLIIGKVNFYKMYLDKNQEGGLYGNLIKYGKREPLATDIFKDLIREDDIILDIGANIGYYVILESLMAKNGRIIAVEPSKNNFMLLKKNIELNNLNNVNVYNIAFGLKNENLKFYISKYGNLSSPIKTENTINEEIVKSMRVDDFLKNKEKPTIIRLDTEGYEYEILFSAKETLDYTDKIFIELHCDILKERKIFELLKFLKNKNFEIEKALPRINIGTENWIEEHKIKCLLSYFKDISIDKLIHCGILEHLNSLHLFLKNETIIRRLKILNELK